MKILLLTSLYPDQIKVGNERQTKALHDFAKIWAQQKNVQLLVVKLHHYPKDEKLYITKKPYKRDGVTIENLYVFDRGVFSKRPRNLKFIPFYLKLKFQGRGLEAYNQERLLKILQKHHFHPDVILGHSMLTFKQACQMSHHFQVPYILGFHRSDVKNLQNNQKWNAFIQAYARDASGIVSRSPSIAKQLQPHFQISGKPFFTAISGINPDLIIASEEAKAKLKAWKSGSRAVRLVSVCNLQKLKNLDVNLRVLAKLPSDIPFTYEIIGEGSERQYLEELSESLGLSQHVHFLDQMPHEAVMEKLRESDIFLMVSSPETLGLAYLEAMARGNLVIGARDNGIDGIAKAPEEVLLCTPRHELALEEALHILLKEKDEAGLIQMLNASLQRIRQLNEERVACDYLGFIQKIANDVQ